ncbi:MAG TPA: Rrf2 family transcriptional regulator [Gemmatimonadales bacterium]|nr:Rrf2 family transcriptional regulator [Gemmatimonadales bacterium]
MLSQTAEYALRTVLYIAERPDDHPARVDEIAGALGLPRNYLSKTLHRLAQGGVLRSTRGVGGGFRLRVPADELPLLTVVKLFDPVSEGRACLLGRPVCSDAHPCEAHAKWKGVAAQLDRFFRETMVADLLEPGAGGRRRPARAGAGAAARRS